METTNSSQPLVNETEPVVTKKEIPVKLSKPLVIALCVFGILILANVLLMVLKKPPNSSISVTPSPFSQPSNPPTERKTSEFAKTPEFLDFENKLAELQEANKNIDLNETGLGFPVLEMHVDFEK